MRVRRGPGLEGANRDSSAARSKARPAGVAQQRGTVKRDEVALHDRIATPRVTGASRRGESAEAGSSAPAAGPHSRLAQEIRALANPLEGLHYFAESQAEPRKVIEKGRPGQPGYQRWEYWPRTREYCYHALSNDAELPDRARETSWRFDARTGLKMLRSEGERYEQHVGEAGMNAFGRMVRAAARKLGAPVVNVRERSGLPEVVAVLDAVTARPPTDPETLRAGDLIAFGDQTRLTFTCLARLEPNEFYARKFLNVYTRGDARIGGSGYDVALEAGMVKPAGYVSQSRRFGLDGNGEGLVGTIELNAASAPRCWRVTDGELAVIVAHRPRLVDATTGTRLTPAGLTIHVALQALQSTRWAASEIESEARGNAEAAAKLRAAFADVTPEAYGRALDALIARFGVKAFREAVTELFDAHLEALHTRDHHPTLPYGPHSDASPLDSVYMRLAREAIRAVHPTPRDMRAHGNVVNVRTLFGDDDFWRHLRVHYRGLFDHAVDHLLTRPSPMKVTGVYGPAMANVVAVVRDFFPAAYAEIRAARPDFASTAATAFQLIPTPQ